MMKIFFYQVLLQHLNVVLVMNSGVPWKLHYELDDLRHTIENNEMLEHVFERYRDQDD